MALDPCLIASLKTSLGWARLWLAVPEVTSQERMSRFFRSRQRVQNFSISRPMARERMNSKMRLGASRIGFASVDAARTRRQISTTVTSWSALTFPMPLNRRNSLSSQLTRLDNDPASFMMFEATFRTLWPLLPLLRSIASSSVSLSADAPNR